MESAEESDAAIQLLAMRDAIYGHDGAPSMFVSGFNYEDDNEGVEGDGGLADEVRDMLQAAENGDLPKIKQLIQKNPDLVNCLDADKYTPMHRAAYNNHAQVVQLLLQNGGKSDARTENGWVPLHCASCWGCDDAAKVLVEEGGGDVNTRTTGGVTPLHLTAANIQNAKGAAGVAGLLLAQHNIQYDAINSAGDTPEDIARRSSKLVFDAIQEFKSKKTENE